MLEIWLHIALYGMPRTFYNRDMINHKKMRARAKIIEAIRALPSYESREAWVKRLGQVLYEMQKEGVKT